MSPWQSDPGRFPPALSNRLGTERPPSGFLSLTVVAHWRLGSLAKIAWDALAFCCPQVALLWQSALCAVHPCCCSLLLRHLIQTRYKRWELMCLCSVDTGGAFKKIYISHYITSAQLLVFACSKTDPILKEILLSQLISFFFKTHFTSHTFVTSSGPLQPTCTPLISIQSLSHPGLPAETYDMLVYLRLSD